MKFKKMALVIVVSAFCFNQLAAVGYFDWWFNTSTFRKGMYVLLAVSALSFAKYWTSCRDMNYKKVSLNNNTECDFDGLTITDLTNLSEEKRKTNFSKSWVVQCYDETKDKKAVKKTF